MNFCPNCGKQVNQGASVCLSCGYAINQSNVQMIIQPNGKALATVSVVFGSLGFYPLFIVGSIVGLITGLIGISDKDNMYTGRSKIGLWLSVGSLSLWLLIIILVSTV